MRILIVEDNDINQKVVVGMLASLDAQYDVVENGAEAVAAVVRSHYDLVLMDIQMPVMDGVEATQKIRSLGGDAAKLPIVAMTSHAMQGDREKYLAAGMDDYIAKPLDRAMLVSMVERCAKAGSPERKQIPHETSVAATTNADEAMPSDTISALRNGTRF